MMVFAWVETIIDKTLWSIGLPNLSWIFSKLEKVTWKCSSNKSNCNKSFFSKRKQKAMAFSPFIKPSSNRYNGVINKALVLNFVIDTGIVVKDLVKGATTFDCQSSQCTQYLVVLCTPCGLSLESFRLSSSWLVFNHSWALGICTDGENHGCWGVGCYKNLPAERCDQMNKEKERHCQEEKR